MNLKSRLLLALIPAILVTFGALMVISFKHSESTVLTQINKESYELARSHAREFDILFESSREIAEGLAISLGVVEELTAETVDEFLQNTLSRNPSVYGSAAAFIPGRTPLGEYAPYYCRSPEGLRFSSLAEPTYDYQRWDWFRKPLASGRGLWAEPYNDVGGGNILMTTYSAPIRRRGEFIGVATVDISLENLVERLGKLALQRGGRAFIVTAEGRLIARSIAGRNEPVSAETLWAYAARSPDPQMKRLAGLIRNPQPDFVDMTDPYSGRPSLVIDARIESINWTLAVIAPREVVLGPLIQLRSTVLQVSAVIVGLIVLIILWVSNSITSPIKRFVALVDQYSQGNFAARLPEDKGPAEIRGLARGFNRLGTAIVARIEEVKNTTAQKESYHKELMIASEIQKGILPRQFPPFPELTGQVGLFGMNRPAREVGGDYFDFIRLPDGGVGLVVADVSGKGAGAALFMAMTRLLVRTMAARGYPPAEVARRTNHMLVQDNEAGMFVTMLYGAYDLATGRVRFVCAGHNPPVRRFADGRTEVISLNHGVPLAVLPTPHYAVTELTLAPGETLVMYSDGVTDAQDEREEEFGMARLEAAVAGAPGGDARRMADSLLAAVDSFAGEAGQPDDITLLTLVCPDGGAAAVQSATKRLDEAIHLTLPARTAVLAKVADMTASVARDVGFPEAEIQRIVLAVDEVVTNVITYAYGPGTSETFELDLIPHGDGMTVTVTDYGQPFDFEKESRKYAGQAAEDQPEGGIGLFLVRRFMDEVRYEPETYAGNVVVMVKHLSGGKPSDAGC
jgi:sigma-B regulation protein RsbU (phosphoserine phosphatase)